MLVSCPYACLLPPAGGWALLPWCATSENSVAEAGEEEQTAAQQGSEEEDEGEGPPAMAQRRLIGFASTASENERLRRALYSSCC